MAETTSGAVLIKAEDGHITRGGEFEKRAAFAPTFALPAGTIGMAADTGGLYVFGSAAAPVMPAGVTYQRLQHPDTVTALSRVLSFELYAGKLYVVGEFADGSIQHYYAGVLVTDWFDGRARASFTVTGGSTTPAVAAVGSFQITGGSLGAGNQITDVKIDGVSLISAPVAHTGTDVATAANVATAINSFASTPDYTATSSGQTVTITAAVAGTAANGKAVVPTVGGNAVVSNAQNMTGGAAAIASALTDLRVNGVSVIGAAVNWVTSNEATAAAIAAAIISFISAPEYTATAVGATVNVVAAVAGANANGRIVSFFLANGLTVSPSSGLTLTDGADSSGTFQPGTFVKTIGQKMYSVSGPNTHFSGIKEPTHWTTDTVGAGFIDMSTESSGSEQLISLARYQQYVAIFAERVIQVWFFDPDPALARQVQVLSNTGTVSANSVTQFGDNDLFYLDESGLRSLRARDSSNAAATTDIGVPIDTIVSDKLTEITETDREGIVGLIEPRDGRFWLVIKDVIYVFSFFNDAKVSAWSTYIPSVVVDGESVPFTIDGNGAVVFNKRVYVRSGDTIYAYGGLAAKPVYDATIAKAWLPFLDAGDPSRKKAWEGIDAALLGEWSVSYAMEPTTPDVSELIANLTETTFNSDRNPSMGASSHISPRFESRGDGAAKLSSIVVHYAGDADED